MIPSRKKSTSAAAFLLLFVFALSGCDRETTQAPKNASSGETGAARQSTASAGPSRTRFSSAEPQLSEKVARHRVYSSINIYPERPQRERTARIEHDGQKEEVYSEFPLTEWEGKQVPFVEDQIEITEYDDGSLDLILKPVQGITSVTMGADGKEIGRLKPSEAPGDLYRIYPNKEMTTQYTLNPNAVNDPSQKSAATVREYFIPEAIVSKQLELAKASSGSAIKTDDSGKASSIAYSNSEKEYEIQIDGWKNDSHGNYPSKFRRSEKDNNKPSQIQIVTLVN